VPVFLARQDCDTSNDINKLSAWFAFRLSIHSVILLQKMVNNTEWPQNYKMAITYTKWPQNSPNSQKNITTNFHFKTLQIVPKLGFLVCKYTIWQPCYKASHRTVNIRIFSSRSMYTAPNPLALAAQTRTL
jgi:hypothetical protein